MLSTGTSRSAAQWRVHLQGGYKSREYVGHKSKVHSLDWNMMGTKLASGSTDHTIRIWNLEKLLATGSTNNNSSELRGHGANIDQLAWSPIDNELLASVSADQSVRFWDTSSMSCTGIVLTGSENINLAWSPDGLKLAVGSKDDTLTIINVENRNIEMQRSLSQEMNEMAWSPTGTEIFVTRGSGTVDIIDSISLETIGTLQAHTANCYCIKFAPQTGKYFAVGAADAIVSLWDLSELACLRTFCRLDWPIRSLSFSSDGDLLASASEDSFIDISHVSTGESVHRLSTTAAINTLAWHPRKTILAYAGDHVDNRSGRSTGTIFLFSS